MRLFLAMALLFSMLTGAVQTQGAETVVAIKKSLLEGSWRYTSGNVVSNYVFKSDGTYTGNISQGGEIQWEFEGKWTIEGVEIVYEITKSSVPIVKVGSKEREKLVEITKDYYIVVTGAGEKEKYERVVK